MSNTERDIEDLEEEVRKLRMLVNVLVERVFHDPYADMPDGCYIAWADSKFK